MTTFVLCSGPSLTQERLALVEREHAAGRGRVIVTNRSFEHVPFADICFGMDQVWWENCVGEVRAAGMKMVSTSNFTSMYGVEVVRKSPVDWGFSFEGVSGNNTGHQAINYAWMTDRSGPIIVVGFDLQRVDGKAHHYGDHPVAKGGHKFNNPTNMANWVESAEKMAEVVRKHRLPIINTSPFSSVWLDLPHMALREAIRVYNR